ncbi:uncharacterized protein L203_105655 [Cryptococcus depauperatus CBS 7841]|uniref:Aminotransferase class I/classII large domain-containing protein n=1 Tax=Cryptococcus depauperatus CBS 7841 TaxID=1295531 RepID=A0AAJ8JXW4_9TREE
MSLSLLDVEAEYIPCEPGNEFKASFVMVKVALSNSVGAVYTPDEIKEWFDLVKDYRLTLVLDETYSGFVESRRVLHKLFEEDGYRRILVSLKSFSKGYRIPGHRLSFIIANPRPLAYTAIVCDCMQICTPRPPTRSGTFITASSS